jgi:methylated-DNA-[protein]-cysteine S-methyltransferase
MKARDQHWTRYESPLGTLTVLAGTAGLTELGFPGRVRVPSEAGRSPMPAVDAQLDAYFAGELQSFALGLDIRGTPLQSAVWRRLLEIPYGQTCSYGELTDRIDPALFPVGVEPWERPRLVGGCIGRNPLLILVPCHRVIGADGSLTGYAGGLQRKQSLLELERSTAHGEAPPASWGNRQIPLI